MTSVNKPDITVLKCPQCGANLPDSSEGNMVCQYCGTGLICNRRGVDTGEEKAVVVRGMRLKQFIYTDKEGTGMEMFRMLMPVGWNFQGGCRWLLDNPGMPASVAFQMWNPQGAEMFEVLPNMNFTWNNNPLTSMMFPVSSRYFGAEVRPPMGIQEALRELVLPRFRSAMQNLQVLNLELQPDLPRLVKSEAPLSGGSAEGGKVRIRYTWQGQKLDEEIYAVVEIFRAPMVSMFGTTEILIWFVDYLFSFRTASGHLDATADLFSLMINSFHLNPQWYAAYKSIVQSLAQQQIQRIHHIGQVSQILAQTANEIREQNLNDWYSRQEVYDRLATDRSRAIRGVDAFMDPHRQEVVELPSGYGNAWANNLGEYILTEDPNFNPNLYSNLHWESMEQK
ncbi:MAG: TFIIB-type zinc finger domain-containing protein [Chloroflexota bacterium]